MTPTGSSRQRLTVGSWRPGLNSGCSISIHAPRVGSDRRNTLHFIKGKDFNPRSPCGERRDNDSAPDMSALNFNPRSPCGERRHRPGTLRQRRNFNPRSPCGERLAGGWHQSPVRSFQSTLPVWGATIPHNVRYNKGSYFNPRSPCGERRRCLRRRKWRNNFNPRSPCGERRTSGTARPFSRNFNPRSPCGERPTSALLYFSSVPISIHAPRVGSDE